MSKHSDFVRGIGIHLYKDRWVLCSSAQVRGGQTLDVPPVRLVEVSDRKELAKVVSELLVEDIPVVPQPDWNNPRMKIGVRALALGLKSWPAFVKNARCFNLEQHKTTLILEEWPREGNSFTADASWRREFSPDAIDDVVEFLVRRAKSASDKPRLTRTRRRSDN